MPTGNTMPDRSAIEWTDATWNPTTGCTPVSAGCDHCYAARMSVRLRATYRSRLPVVNRAENRRDPFAVRLWPERLSIPGSWRAPRRVFVNSMSDLFHRDIPNAFVRKCFRVMLEVDRHVYQVLTKRPARAARFVAGNPDLLPEGLPRHIWIGTSIEDQSVDYRVRHLIDVAAQVRFLSCEPLIAPLDLDAFLRGPYDLHWVIVGGESGPGARPADPEWVRMLRNQCLVAGVPFFFKQWGGTIPQGRRARARRRDVGPVSPRRRPRSRLGPASPRRVPNGCRSRSSGGASRTRRASISFSDPSFRRRLRSSAAGTDASSSSMASQSRVSTRGGDEGSPIVAMRSPVERH